MTRKQTVNLSLPIIAIYLLATSCFGSNVSEYRSRLGSAREDVQQMVALLQAGRTSPGADQLMAQAARRIVTKLPASERIELAGNVIETSNGWLGSDLERARNEGDTALQIAILNGIAERLSSLDAEAKQLDLTVDSGRTKDEDKKKLNEILTRPEYQKADGKDDSLFQKWLNWLVEWITGLFPHSEIPNSVPSGFQPLSIVIQVLVYGIVIGLIGFLLYRFAPILIGRFTRSESRERSSRVVLGEHIDASRSSSDLLNEAEQLARQGDLRAAIRKGYIALLCDLADKKVIGLARHKTNRDYLRDVRNYPSLFASMKRATGSFEFHWYGFRTPNEKDWEDFREQYKSAVSHI
jgi:hypothetical protein